MSSVDAAQDDGPAESPATTTASAPTATVTEVPAEDEPTTTTTTAMEIDDVQDMGEVTDSTLGTETTEKPPVAPPPSTTRPILQRNVLQRVNLDPAQQGNGGGGGGSGPMPQAPAPPLPTDSLSLAQLRKIVSEVNRPEQAAYDFVYADMGPHAEEIDEWFMYQFWQWVRLSSAQKAFEWHWNQETTGNSSSGQGGNEVAWEDADHDTRTRFVQAAIAGVQSNDAALRSASIGKLVYLVLGRWGDTAMPNTAPPDDDDEKDGDGATRSKGPGKSIASIMQLQAIKAGVECLASLEGLPVVWEALRHAFELHWSGEAHNTTQPPNGQGNSPQEPQDELMNLMTIMYIALQEVLSDPEDMSASYGKLLELQPPLTEFMMTATTKLRWDEHNVLPSTQIFLLFWKSILLVFGGTKDLQRVKKATSELGVNQEKQTITASPLDYHVFRQEIVSKYPAYVPPQPAIPLEDENTSLLPPLPQHTSRNNAANGILPAPSNSQIGGASILHQPVHIATPAPSPPPSPGVGGKGGKKQNYQTNQNFPFMYPPLDATSNSAGGKGLAALDDTINRRWEGSDIPASILEAGELFSTRVRMTRATRQLWDEREGFLKFERGWDAEEDDDDIPDLDLSELTEEERELLKEVKDAGRETRQPAAPAEAIDYGPRRQEITDRDKKRLEAVESFYHQALPHLQSLVIVLLRPVFANVAAIVSQQGPQMNQGMQGRSGPGMNGGPNDNGRAGGDPPELSPEEVDAARTREITTKAMSGILVLLLKWLRLSHVLRFEYFTQLLLDSNYVPLVLKLFAHQDVQQVVDSKMDRMENSFFQFCNLRSKFKDRTESDLEQDDEEEEGEDQQNGADEPDMEAEESDDSAAPPPIKRRRSPSAEMVHGEQMAEPTSLSSEEDGNPGMRPEVDELGYPVNDLPMEPITDFSWRNFFSLINYLRVMQKICKAKAHRNLLLVQYKSSTILRKSLRIPQPELRLYTLKLFKNQVPYCGRKWRQSNMRVITAVYLHCRPELRDEWLAGSDIDAEVDSALPLEQALRGLTHWFNVRRYPEQTLGGIATTAAEYKEKQQMQYPGQQQIQPDFFTRELERLDLDWSEMSGDDGMSEMEGW